MELVLLVIRGGDGDDGDGGNGDGDGDPGSLEHLLSVMLRIVR